jgi:ATP-binding protein involved in chromosome partitioning
MIEPVQIIEESDSDLTINWSDDAETRYRSADLRRACPCASCIDEWTGKKTLRDESVANDVSFSHISIVGRYALNFHFSDGHETGIYTFTMLRKLGE